MDQKQHDKHASWCQQRGQAMDQKQHENHPAWCQQPPIYASAYFWILKSLKQLILQCETTTDADHG